MTKRELVTRLNDKTGYAPSHLSVVLTALGEVVAEALAAGGEGERVKLTGVVTLHKKWVAAKPAHQGTNPMTGESVWVEAQPLGRMSSLKGG